MNETIYLKDYHPSEIIGQVFVSEGHFYRIERLVKTWGAIPVLFARAELMDEHGKVSYERLSIKPNLKASSERQSWMLTIGEN